MGAKAIERRVSSALCLCLEMIQKPGPSRRPIGSLAFTLGQALALLDEPGKNRFDDGMSKPYFALRSSYDTLLIAVGTAKTMLLEPAISRPEAYRLGEFLAEAGMAVGKIRLIIKQMRSASYSRKGVGKLSDQGLYKGRFAIAAYDKEGDLAFLCDNPAEFAQEAGLGLATAQKGLSLVFWGKRKSIVVDGKKMAIEFIDVAAE